MSGDNVFASSAVARQIIGLQQEGPLRWRAHFFGVDMGSIEIAPLRDALAAEPVTLTVSTVQEAQRSPSPPPQQDRIRSRRRPSEMTAEV